jgi:hypothetical protein
VGRDVTAPAADREGCEARQELAVGAGWDNFEGKVASGTQNEREGEMAETPQDVPAPAAAAPKAKISKKDAVRRSLAKLGKKAFPRDIQADVKARFGIDMTTDHISTTKGEIAREAAAKKLAAQKPAQKAEGQKPPAQQKQPPAGGNGKPRTIALEDVLALKALMDRVGADSLRTLIAAFER